MFTGLKKITQKHGHRKRKVAWEKIKSYILKQKYLSVKDENSTASKHFDLRNGALWRFRKENSSLRRVK
jgi:hypothetical protein